MAGIPMVEPSTLGVHQAVQDQGFAPLTDPTSDVEVESPWPWTHMISILTLPHGASLEALLRHSNHGVNTPMNGQDVMPADICHMHDVPSSN